MTFGIVFLIGFVVGVVVTAVGYNRAKKFTDEELLQVTTYIHGLILKGEAKGHTLLNEWTHLVSAGTLDAKNMSQDLLDVVDKIRQV